MKAFAVLTIVVLSAVSAIAATETCQKCLTADCSQEEVDCSDLKKCTARYSGALADDNKSVLKELQRFAFNQLDQSFEFMLRASYFGNYKASRDGLAKLFRGLSDSAWNDAIAVAKLVAQRGGDSVFVKEPKDWWGKSKVTIAVNELRSLGRALDSVKDLATEANAIHHRATHHVTGKDASPDVSKHQHDAHIAHFIQEEFSGRYAEEVRSLAGHASDLKQLLVNTKSASEKSLSLFLFDEYLLKL